MSASNDDIVLKYFQNIDSDILIDIVKSISDQNVLIFQKNWKSVLALLEVFQLNFVSAKEQKILLNQLKLLQKYLSAFIETRSDLNFNIVQVMLESIVSIHEEVLEKLSYPIST